MHAVSKKLCLFLAMAIMALVLGTVFHILTIESDDQSLVSIGGSGSGAIGNG